MAKQHALSIEGGVVVCDECGEKQEPNANANPKLKLPCEGFQGANEHGIKMSRYKSKKEKMFHKYPMMKSYSTEDKAERARSTLYGKGPYPPAWRLPIDDREEE